MIFQFPLFSYFILEWKSCETELTKFKVIYFPSPCTRKKKKKASYCNELKFSFKNGLLNKREDLYEEIWAIRSMADFCKTVQSLLKRKKKKN